MRRDSAVIQKPRSVNDSVEEERRGIEEENSECVKGNRRMKEVSAPMVSEEASAAVQKQRDSQSHK